MGNKSLLYCGCWQWDGISLVTQMVKNLPAMQETLVRSLGWEDPLETGMATHSSSCLREFHEQIMGLQRLRHDLATKTSLLGMVRGRVSKS